MTTYDDLFNQGQSFQKLKKTEEARACYMRALLVGGNKDIECRQQIGVCCKMEGNYTLALTWLGKALEEGPSRRLRGNILRDMADVLSLLGRHEEALSAINESIDLLCNAGRIVEWGCSFSYRGRVLIRSGQILDGVGAFHTADNILDGQDPDQDLYHKVSYAYALSRFGDRSRSHSICRKAWRLSKKAGARAHKVRIAIIWLGGYRLDDRIVRLGA